MTGRIIAYTVGYKKDKMRRFLDASKILRDKQHIYQGTQAQRDKREWETAKSNFDLAEKLDEQTVAHANTLRYHNYGNKAGKLLSCLIKGPYTSDPIRAMRERDGATHTDPIAINKALTEYYIDLYKRDPLDTEAAADFLAKLQLPTLKPDDLQLLNSPITIEEVGRGISNLENGKTPGPDGLTAEYYKALKEDLTTPLFDLYTAIWEGAPYFPTGKEAHIKGII